MDKIHKERVRKGYLRRSVISSPTLGMRENTCMTVTVREVLLTITEFFGNLHCFFLGGEFFTRLLFIIYAKKVSFQKGELRI